MCGKQPLNLKKYNSSRFRVCDEQPLNLKELTKKGRTVSCLEILSSSPTPLKLKTQRNLSCGWIWSKCVLEPSRKLRHVRLDLVKTHSGSTIPKNSVSEAEGDLAQRVSSAGKLPKAEHDASTISPENGLQATVRQPSDKSTILQEMSSRLL